MSPSNRLHRVREHLAALDLGDIERESIVIAHEHYVGRRFELTGHRAVWFAEEDELKIYSRGGGHVQTLGRAELDRPAEIVSPLMTLPMFPAEPAADVPGEIRRAA